MMTPLKLMQLDLASYVCKVQGFGMAERLSGIQGIKITLNALADEIQARAPGISRLR